MTVASPSSVRDAEDWKAIAGTLHRAALAVARPGGPALFDELLGELVASLAVRLGIVGLLEGAGPWRWLAVRLDGRALPLADHPLREAARRLVESGGFQLLQQGAAEVLPLDGPTAEAALRSLASYPLHDSAGQPIGLLVVADGAPMPHADLAQALLTIFGTRMAAGIERLRTDEALRQSEADYRAIFEAAEDSIVIHDWDTGRAVDLNPKACESCGYTREELLGSHPARLGGGVSPYSEVEAQHYLERARRGESPRFEWQRRNKDGSLHWGEVSLKTALIGGRRHILAFRRDITERKQALEALRLKEEQYRVIFEAASDTFVLRDRQLRTIEANPAFYRQYGFDPKHIAAGGGYPASFPQAYIDEREAQIRAALEGRETHVETIALRADGSPFWIDLRVIPVQYRGEPHVLQIGRDITALREREQALKRSEARLRATVEAAFDSIVGMDDQGRIIEFNATAERVFGHRRDDVLGRSLAELIIPARHRAAHTRGLAQFLAGGHGPFLGRLIETAAVRSDGSEFPVELAISVGATEDSRIFIGHLRDITRRRATAARREELEAQLRQAQKMEAIGQLTGGIAHDFNNILTSVIGYIVMAGERPAALQDERLAHQLEQAHRAAQRARELIAQMLTFARRGRSERKALALGPALRQSLVLLRSTLPSTIELQADFAAGLPTVSADAVQIEQVLFNLCINARDAMAGTGRLRVGLQLRQAETVCASCRQPVRGAWIEFAVADDGGGITAEVQERMFDPFYTTKEVGRGSGMGLAMVHGIVHGHGGHVVVDSEAGRGSCFRVLLPPEAASDRAAAAEPAASTGTAARPRLQGRLLLVEDEAMVGSFMSDLLGGWGLDVTLCRDPLAAERRFHAAPDAFDIVLTDQAMPGLSGSELAQRLLALRPALPVLLYTGFDEGLDEAELRRRGLRAVLPKPIDRERLLAVLRECL